ncbi:OmpH family outer membrane protein [Vibrio sp. S17_S38]|uniref:OmpH family outer membrane protein n=1 Tax=Vibrio sp. S17_S38 TaxID=2720229 RepID=UPI00168062D1|nr:OmpH family outer membrane protein [Vibrio sp. S17_S38]
MKKLMKITGISLVVLTASLTAQAAQAAQKIGYVNTAKVFQTVPQAQAVEQKLEKSSKDKRAELDKLKKQIDTKVEKLKRDAQLMSTNDVDNLRIDIQSMQAKLEVKGKSFQADINKMKQEEMQKINVKIQAAIDKVAKKDGYDIVLNGQALVYATPSADITDSVIKELK